MLQHQAEIYTREMLLDAKWIAGGRYFLRRGKGHEPSKYWDEQGYEITAFQASKQTIERMNGKEK